MASAAIKNCDPSKLHPLWDQKHGYRLQESIFISIIIFIIILLLLVDVILFAVWCNDKKMLILK